MPGWIYLFFFPRLLQAERSGARISNPPRPFSATLATSRSLNMVIKRIHSEVPPCFQGRVKASLCTGEQSPKCPTRDPVAPAPREAR